MKAWPMREGVADAALHADARVRFRGSSLARAILGLAGWRLVFDGVPTRQGVIVLYPHTSNWDFVVCVLAKWAAGIPLNFWSKDSLFRVPVLGAFIRSVGGVAVDRTHANGVVGSMAQRFAQAKADDTFLWLALSPEGTRQRREAWRSGFYHLARSADVPLGLGFIDYTRCEVGCDTFIDLTDDADADMARIAAVLGDRQGFHPEQAAPIRLEPKTP